MGGEINTPGVVLLLEKIRLLQTGGHVCINVADGECPVCEVIRAANPLRKMVRDLESAFSRLNKFTRRNRRNKRKARAVK